MPFTFQDEEHVRRIVREEVKDQLTDFRSAMLSQFDQVLSEIVAMRQDMTVYSHRQSEQSNQLETHEAKLQKVESKLNLPS